MHGRAPRLMYDLGRLARYYRTSQMSSQWYVHDRKPGLFHVPVMLMLCCRNAQSPSAVTYTANSTTSWSSSR